MTTVARGRCTSAPAPLASAIGMKPSDATSAVISTGRRRVCAPWGARRLAPDLELVDLAEPGGDRAHLGLAVARGDLALRGAEALADELARPVDVGAVLEDHGHDRQAELRDRADLLDPRQPAHGGLDREGDEALDLLGGEAGAVGQDLDLDVGDVGDGVDRELAQRADPDGDRRTHPITTRRRLSTEKSMMR